MTESITVRNLHKRYGDHIAVDDVTFSVRSGEVFGLLGPNGAGKTTTVEILQGLRSRQGGTVEVLGLDPATAGDTLRRQIGSQLQSSALPDRLRVEEAARLFSASQPSRVDVAEVLDSWDLTALRRQPFATLSGGQKQRLFLALALLGNPEVVFLDELTTGLDPTARRATWELVRDVRDQGATVVLVTHFMEEAEELCDRVAVFNEGRIVALDTPSRLTATHGEEVGVTFSVNGHDPRHLSSLDGVNSLVVRDGQVTIRGTSKIPLVVAAELAGRGIYPLDYRTHYPNLEDVFLALTGRSLTKEENQ